jgi:hypothetical protein
MAFPSTMETVCVPILKCMEQAYEFTIDLPGEILNPQAVLFGKFQKLGNFRFNVWNVEIPVVENVSFLTKHFNVNFPAA